MHLVDEQDDVLAVRDLFDHPLHPLLELAAVLGAGHQCRHIQRHQLLVAQDVRHLLGGNQLRQPLGDGGLANARVAQQQRVVLGAPRQYLHHPLDLVSPADHRVELVLLRLLGEVGAKLVKDAVALGVVVLHEVLWPGVGRRLV